MLGCKEKGGVTVEESGKGAPFRTDILSTIQIRIEERFKVIGSLFISSFPSSCRSREQVVFQDSHPQKPQSR